MVSVDYQPRATLNLTEDEAFSILAMCMLTNMKLDMESERALRKLADFCKSSQYFPHSAQADASQLK